MKLVYLLGYPLDHSISPEMQNAALRACGLDDWQYEKLAFPPAELAERANALRAPECAGANVTIPHKQTIMPYLDELSETARAIGAINTIVQRSGRLIGENTDAPGFAALLREEHIRPRHARVLLMGAGGAAAAVAYALAEQGIRQLVIVNRTALRAADLADRLHARFPRLELAINAWELLPQMNLLVNATGAGMAPAAATSPLPSGLTIPRGAVVVDLVYNPAATRLLQQANAAGARGIGGLGMLVHQGAESFKLWTGEAAPVAIMRAAALRALEQASGRK